MSDERTPLLPSDARDGTSPAIAQETNISNAAIVEVNGHHSVAIPKTAAKPPRQVNFDLYRGILMVFMCWDHLGVTSNGWQHSQGGGTNEEPDAVVTKWNDLIPFIGRCLSHLCAPGFGLLMGVGIGYFSSSRMAAGWTTSRFLHHYGVRMLGIIVVNYIITAPYLLKGFWLLNFILWALAIDYFLVGCLALLVERSIEPALSGGLERLLQRRRKGVSRLSHGYDTEHDPTATIPTKSKHAEQAETFAHYTINILLFILSAFLLLLILVIWPSDRHCVRPFVDLPPTFEVRAGGPFDRTQPYAYNFFVDILFFEVLRADIGVMSGFPPFAWLPYVVFGYLYARVLIRNKWRPSVTAALNTCIGAVFALLFVSTRLLQWGSLADDCLQTPEQGPGPVRNQYLSGPHSFFYVTKYPPSPAFGFYTMSVTYFFLAALIFVRNPQKNPVWRVLLTYGTNALFYYGFHLYLLLILAAIFVHGRISRPLPWDPDSRGIFPQWLAVFPFLITLTVSYFACKGYGRFKSKQGPDSLWRFF